MTDQPSYTYNAEVVRWVDGDTVDLRVDVGFYTHIESRFRLYGVDTPERGQPNHDEAVTFVNGYAHGRTYPNPDDPEEFVPGAAVTVTTYKPVADKYGRFLATVQAGDPATHPSVNAELVARGLARPYFGGTKGA